MWRATLLAFALAGAACGGGGGGKGAPTTPGAIDPFSAVGRAVEQWRQGWEVRSMDALAPLYRHDDHTVVVYQGQAHVGWPQAETYLRSVVDGAREVHLTVSDGQVAALGDSGATYAARLTREISDGAVAVSDTGFLTLTFARSGAAWEIVAEHYSYRAGP